MPEEYVVSVRRSGAADGAVTAASQPAPRVEWSGRVVAFGVEDWSGLDPADAVWGRSGSGGR